ncbi:hypothetical protein [Nocardiopsis dassonvillei]|uniref:hypothetical protein n=1 Tax=Nocardiopsis dassonvillei TaxID=2014 RepID=UPI00157C021D|nr:hypothetical protein [Nocardiopsis dassonvillei]
MSITGRDRAAELADRFFSAWDTDGDRDRVIDRIAWMREHGVGDHVITNVAKSVQGKKRPVSFFMEVTSSEPRWMAAALAGSQIYPAPGIAPPKESLPEEERPLSWPTMCKIHGTRLYPGRDEEVPTRCARCESEGDYSRRAGRPPRR